MSNQRNRNTRWGLILGISAILLGLLSIFANPVYAVTTVHDVHAKWVKAHESQTISPDGLLTTETSTVRMQIGFSTSGNDPIQPGQLQIKIPRDVFRMHGDYHAKISYPWQSSGDYQVTDDPANDYIIITNKIKLNAATQQSIDISYDVTSGTHVWGNTKNTPFKISVELPGQPPKYSTELRTKYVNRTVIKHVRKEMGSLHTSWQNGWDESKKPANADDYWYGVWRISFGTTDSVYGETGASDQAIKMWLEDNQSDGTIIGYSKIQDGSYTPSLEELTDTIEERGDRNDTQDGYVDPAQNYSLSVIVAYPKTMFQGDDPVTVENTITMHLKNDSDPWEEKTATGSYTFEPIGWYDGDNFGLGTNAQKRGIKWVYGGITILDEGVDVSNLDFRLSAEAFNSTQMQSGGESYALMGDEFTMVLNDDILYIPLADGPLRLGPEDYEASGFSVKFSAQTLKADFTTGKWGKTSVENWDRLEELGRNPIMTVSGYRDGQWVKIAEAKHNPVHNDEGTDMFGSMMFTWYDEALGEPDSRDHFTLNEGTGFTRLQWSVTANPGVTEPLDSRDPGFDPSDYIFYMDVGSYGTNNQFFSQNWQTYNAVADSHGCQYNVRLFHDGPNVQAALEAHKAGTAGGDNGVNPGGGAVEGPNGEDKPLYVDNVSSYFYTKDGEVLGTRDTGTSVASDPYYRDDVFDFDTIYGSGGSEKVKFMGGDAEPNSGDGSYIIHRIGRNYLTEITMGSGMSKSVSTIDGGQFGQRYRGIQNDPDNKRVMVPWHIAANSWYAGEPEGIQNLIDAGLFETLNDGVIYDLLPLGMTLEDDSIIVRVPGESSTSARTLVRDQDYFVEHVPNYKNSGQELIKIRFNYDNPEVNYTRNNGHVTSRVEVYMRTYYSWDAIYDYGDTFHNLGAFETNGKFLPEGEYSIPTSDELTEEEKVLLEGLDPEYTETEGEIPGRFHYTRSEDVTINELTQARYGLSKTILGPESPYWGTGRVDETDNQIVIPTGGLYQYRLRYAPSEGTSVRDMILYDAMEAYDPDEDTPEKLEERGNTTGTPSDTEDVGTVRWKGTLQSIDVTHPKTVIGKIPDVYITCTEGFIVDEKAAEDHEGKVPTYHDNPNLDVSNPDGSDTEWIQLEVDPATNVATIPDEYLGKVTGIAIDMRTGKNGQEFVLDNRKTVTVILNMQGPTDPAEVRRLIKEAEALGEIADNTAATLPYTYNGVSMNSILRHSTGTEDDGAVITNYYTRLTLKIPYGSIDVRKNVVGLDDTSDLEFSFRATVKNIEGATVPFSGKYYILDVATGRYVDVNGGLVNAQGYPVDEEGNVGSEKVDEETYTHTTEDGTFSFKAGQRALLVDAVGDLEWTITEIGGTDGFVTSNNVNGGEEKSGTTSDKFIIGDRQQAHVTFTNKAYGELLVSKKVATGSKTKEFEFTLTLTKGGEPFEGELEYKGEGGKASGTLTFDEEGKATFKLKDGESIRATLSGDVEYEVSEQRPVNYDEPQATGASGKIERGKTSKATFTNRLVPEDKPRKSIIDPETGDPVAHLDLGKYSQPVDYLVTVKVPNDAVKIVITDTIEDVFEFVSADTDVTVTREDGSEVEGAEVSISGKTLTVKIQDGEGEEENYASALRNEKIDVTFTAKLIDGADLSAYVKSGSTKVPNVVSVSFNDRPALTSAPTTVTPPEKPTPPTKTRKPTPRKNPKRPVVPFTGDVAWGAGAAMFAAAGAACTAAAARRKRREYTE